MDGKPPGIRPQESIGRREAPRKEELCEQPYTLGCKVNQYETQILIQQFAAYGYDIVDSSDAADVHIINSLYRDRLRETKRPGR